jgi:DNA-binding transcriptional LysR family regulator
VLHDWCLAGLGIAWRSDWEVRSELQAGRLVSVLDEFAALPTASTPSSPTRAISPCACGCGSTS